MAEIFSQGKDFNPKSRENVILHRTIQRTKNELAAINEILTTEEQYLKEYIEKKDRLYQSIRTRKDKDKNK